jgi:hypothetical protein
VPDEIDCLSPHFHHQYAGYKNKGDTKNVCVTSLFDALRHSRRPIIDTIADMNPSPVSASNLKRDLKARHLMMIAIGGAIGTGFSSHPARLSRNRVRAARCCLIF